MTFLDLYGEALTHELGSADMSQLFTTLRRKAAINRAQREFARLTQCYVVVLTTPITDGVAAIDLDAVTTAAPFVNFSRRPARLAITTTASGAVRYQKLPRHDAAWLEMHRPGWRDSDAKGVPELFAFDPDAGVNDLVLVPTPAIPAGETWALELPYRALPTDLADDTHSPFGGANPIASLEPWHWALAHFAAAQLERLRKDREAEESQLAKFGAYVQDYNAQQRRTGGDRRVTQQRDYGRPHHVRGALVQGDPRI